MQLTAAQAQARRARRSRRLPRGSRVRTALGVALAYALVGWIALLLAGPLGYASPLYPSAGIALAATLTFGRRALPGVWLGAFAVNLGLGFVRGDTSWLGMLAVPAAIGLGAMAQAALGAWLIGRTIGAPVVLNAPREILLAGLLGAAVACAVSPSIATPALAAAGLLDADRLLSNWITWWVGDTLGVLIGAPLALTVIGRPRDDWKPRRRTLGVPLVLALALLAGAMAELGRIDRERARLAFERDADRLAADVQARLRRPLYALQALHGAVLASGVADAITLRAASRWWLEQPWPIQGMGWNQRVPRSAIPAFEAAARSEGLADFRVFQRDDGRALERDGEAMVLRRIEPRQGNATALGVNVLSIPEGRIGLLAARRSGGAGREPGLQADAIGARRDRRRLLPGAVRRPAGERERPRTRDAGIGLRQRAARSAARRRGRVARRRPALVPRRPGARHHAAAPRRPGRLRDRGAPAAGRFALREIDLAGRALELRAHTPATGTAAGEQSEWLLSLTGLAGAAMLGALLLTVTGHSRRTELAVQAGTADLRREVAERRLAEEALRQSEARIRSILENAPLGVAFLDPHGQLLDGNRRLYEMLARPPGKLHGMRVAEIAHEDDRGGLEREHRDLLAGRIKVARRQIKLLRGDGKPIAVRVAASALRDGDGRVTRMIALVEDLAEHLRLEEAERELHRAEAASRAKSEFVSRMSHELRTPLNAMIGFAQLLSLDRDSPLPERQADWAQQIQRAGWHLLELINETLDLARIESGAVRMVLQPVEAAPMVAACWTMIATAAQQRSVLLEEQHDRDLPALKADPTRLRQVLTNLLSNAVKYNREGGKVLVQARAVDGGRVAISVTDSGLGMTATQMQGLFQPYNRLGRETSGIEGTGIGLVISRRLAELMGGSLEATSQAERGSTFTLTLPVADASAAAGAAEPASSAPDYRRRRVLYVEDNETNVEVMRGILAQRPQIVLEVSALGLDGLQAARRQRPDLLLLDMQLPDISGLELLRHLKNDVDGAGIPVIVVSADASPGRIEEALTLGAAHYVTKPIDAARFVGLVDEVLQGMETRWGL